MMTRIKRLVTAMAAAIVLGLAGCGGSGGIGDGPAAGGGISGTGRAARGTVTAKNSLTVRDKRFDTDRAVFEVEDIVDPTLDDIKLGMVVEIEGEVVDGVTEAKRVTTEDAIKGPVGSRVSATEMVVLGQTVIRDADTALEDFSGGPGLTDFNDLAANDIIEVHGAVGDAIRATYVKRKDPSNLPTGFQYKVKGTIDSVAGNTLIINGLTVDASSADLSDLPVGGPVAGLFVEVKFDPGLEPVAAKVELDGIDLPNDFLGELRVEGTVTGTTSSGTAFAPGDSFSVGGQDVRTSPTTVFVGGLAAELVAGSVVEAEGQFASGGFLAFKVKFKDSVRLESDVASNVGGTLGLVHLPGITVMEDPFTEFNVDSGLTVTSLADLTTAHFVRVRGRRVGSTGVSVIASRIDVESADDDDNADSRRIEVTLQGPVEMIADPNLMILGITVDTTTTANEFLEPDDFQDENDTAIGRAEFFSRLVEGNLVKAQGRERDGTFAWREVELEE